MSSSDKRRVTGKESPKFFALTNYRDGNDALEIGSAKDLKKIELVKNYLQVFFQSKPSGVQKAT